MTRRIIAYILCLYFLIGNILLPLGDFSLMKGLPAMYHAYEKIASPDERGVLDFVGDYLLGGKDLLGHNKDDISLNNKSDIQFQHTVGVCTILTDSVYLVAIGVKEHRLVHYNFPNLITVPGFHQELLRPPLG
jgi:hypothetical protein